MNQVLDTIAAQCELHKPENEALRLAFAYACAARVRHLLELPQADQCLTVLDKYLKGHTQGQELDVARAEIAHLANSHPGSKSIDGCGHAAVSATYAVAKAVQGKALEAASYAAYAAVYAQGGSAAIADRDAFESEFNWQCNALRSLHQTVSDRRCAPGAG